MQQKLVEQLLETEDGDSCFVRITAEFQGDDEETLTLFVQASRNDMPDSALESEFVFSLPNNCQAPGILKFDPGIAAGAFAICILPKLVGITYDQITQCFVNAKSNSKTNAKFRTEFLACLKSHGMKLGFQVVKAFGSCLKYGALGLPSQP